MPPIIAECPHAITGVDQKHAERNVAASDGTDGSPGSRAVGRDGTRVPVAPTIRQSGRLPHAGAPL